MAEYNSVFAAEVGAVKAVYPLEFLPAIALKVNKTAVFPVVVAFILACVEHGGGKSAEIKGEIKLAR